MGGTEGVGYATAVRAEIAAKANDAAIASSVTPFRKASAIDEELALLTKSE
jgi:hypothetical protein